MAQNTSEKTLKFIMIAIVAIVLVLAVVAIGPVISKNYKINKAREQYIENYNAQVELNNKLQAGTATVAEIADSNGMEVDELLTYYGIADAGLNGDSKQTDFEAKITLAKYAEFKGKTAPTEEEWTAFKTAKSLGDDVTMDTLDMVVKADYIAYVEEKEAAEAAAAEAEAAVADTAEVAEVPAE